MKYGKTSEGGAITKLYDTAREAREELGEGVRPVVTFREWNRMSKDYKSIKEGTPYMLYLDEETGGTTLGPCYIIGGEL